MSEGTHPETWHRLFLREEKQEIAREDLGLGTAATEDAAAFADDTHTHVPGDITGLDDYLSSVVGGLLVEGDGITLTQDSVTGAITIDASVSGGIAVDVLDEGGTIGGAFSALNFVGAGVSVTDAGSGVAAVSIPGAASPVWTTIKKTADESRSSTTTAAADSHLAVALGAGKTYAVRMVAFLVIANATMDYKFGFSYSGTLAAVESYRGFNIAGATGGAGLQQNYSDRTLPGAGSVAGTTAGLAIITWDAVIDTTSAGTLAFTWAQDTSNASNVTVRKGSYLEVMEVA